MKNPFVSIVTRSFYDITSSQIKAHKSNYLALKYVDKWKNFVKSKKNLRVLQTKTRFWPGD
jgi:hypothetical protein